MITTVGYILAGLNLLLTVLLAALRIADDRIENLKVTIRDELKMAYSEWVDQLYQTEAEWRNIGETSSRAARLARLHFSLLNDYADVRSATALLDSSLWIAIMFVIIAIGSVIAASVVIGPSSSHSAVKIVLAVGIPFCGFVVQCILLFALERRSKWARHLIGRYTRKEY